MKPETVYLHSLLIKTAQNRLLTKHLFEKLFAELTEQLPQLELHLNRQEFIQARTIVHKLHGSVSFCGFNKLQKLAYHLESSLSVTDSAQITENFLVFKQELELLQRLQTKILALL
jgi:HPt (histidine-containing phosphotransfer) domain-containing protein